MELALFGGEYQEGVLTAYCSIEDVPHVELNGHILVPLQNVASLHCLSRCDAPEPDWPPRGLDDKAIDPGPGCLCRQEFWPGLGNLPDLERSADTELCAGNHLENDPA